ncbi:GNAT family N-acetyltransferase [Pontixanthobacter sp.]|uniref:GNAT family N-acetyltransferase n=1 Tax=Pontixanthobacter sp. TaxID=2792078 RepID=UPI003C7AAA17
MTHYVAFPVSKAVEPLGGSAAALSWDCDPLEAQLCAQLEEEWTELASDASEQNPFLFPHFIAQSLALFSDQSARLLAIRDAGILIAIVILRRDVGYAKLPVPFLRSAVHHEQFLCTPLVRAGYEAQFATGLCAWLEHAPAHYCFVKLSMIGADGPIAHAITHHCGTDGRRVFAANRFERAAIVPRGTNAGEVDDLLTANRRKSIRRATKGLAKMGAVTFERLSDGAQLVDWTGQFFAMENTGWKQKNGSSILSCEHETALYRRMIVDAFAAGKLQFTRLCLDGEPIAYTLDIAAGPTVFCLKSAIDQRYRKFSPGVLMELETLKTYLTAKECTFVDSCTAPDNSMLNELWPDRKALADLLIARKGIVYAIIFRAIHMIKLLLNTAVRI